MSAKALGRVWLVALASALMGLLVASPFLLLWFSEQRSHWQNRKSIEASFEQRLLPAASWVKGFASRERRLPTDEEMQAYSASAFKGNAVAIFREPPPWQATWGVAGEAFMLCDSVPEWNLYYRSWNRQRIEAWTD